MIEKGTHFKVTSVGQPNPVAMRGFEDWLIDCAIRWEKEAAELAECETAVVVVGVEMETAEIYSS